MINMNAHDTQNEIIYRITEVVENRNKPTGSHSRRVSEVTKVLAKKLGYSEDEAENIAKASIMHDIGKIAVEDSILLKPGKLTSEEFDIIKKHTVIGYNILKDSKYQLLQLAANIALYHNERYDGKGYPEGKKSGDIPKECEIVQAADVFEALISKRCYKESWSKEDVISYFRENREVQFAPDVVDAFLDNVDEIFDVVMSLPE